nr:MAG TPA: hypothetical protein [Caudoviricetes sp.]
MTDEIEEIMDESEIFNPKEYMKTCSNVLPMLVFLSTFYRNMRTDNTKKLFVQFCFYEGEWVLAGFTDGNGALGTIPAVTDYYKNALFVKTVTDTGIGNNIDINSRSRLQDTLEAKLIKEGLREFFDFVSAPCSSPLQEHRSVGWYVRGIKK